jgi:hypothetical protein
MIPTSLYFDANFKLKKKNNKYYMFGIDIENPKFDDKRTCTNKLTNQVINLPPISFTSFIIKINVPTNICNDIYNRRCTLLNTSQSPSMTYEPHITLIKIEYMTNYPPTKIMDIKIGSIGKIINDITKSNNFKLQSKNTIEPRFIHDRMIINNRACNYQMLGVGDIKYLAKCFKMNTVNLGIRLTNILIQEIKTNFARLYSNINSNYSLVYKKNTAFLNDTSFECFYLILKKNKSEYKINLSNFPAFIIPSYYYLNTELVHITVVNTKEIELFNNLLLQDIMN